MGLTNLYPSIMAGGRIKISKRGRETIERLDRSRQIDHDRLGRPIVLRVDQQHGLDQIYMLRDNKVVAVTVNPRGHREPVLSWNMHDGWLRPAASALKQQRQNPGARRERLRRDHMSNYDLDSVLGRL